MGKASGPNLEAPKVKEIGGEKATRLALMSNAFLALIWWVVPATGLLGALGYVLWVTRLKDKYETQTARSVNQFQRFQGAFRKAKTVALSVDGQNQDQSTSGERTAGDAPFDQERDK